MNSRSKKSMTFSSLFIYLMCDHERKCYDVPRGTLSRISKNHSSYY
ncbi:hypothetical protein NRI_0932 [Neorickettsia risticii str. Illinois]|uniref:Uncharacterized protein n=1 Tax=Neorickettsia risticii (strain Illinois) TaxID=434131 RepID=C6V680_NEORI|nr:hypothetical protein NRI_0932 [Neorickettsia risticii str. Illinois]